ncbi:MAG: hypothetical protein AAFY78_20760 [Cyanobacteria bacterium J06648_16]
MDKFVKDRAEMMLFLIRLLHLIVTIYMFACLFYMTYCHVGRRHTPLLTVAYLSVLIETMVFLSFGAVCPLRLWVSHLYSPSTADILLPSGLSQHITGAGMILLAIAIVTKLLGSIGALTQPRSRSIR